MTAKELIAMLEKCPPDALIMLEDEDGMINELSSIEVRGLVKTPSLYDPRITWYYFKGAIEVKGRTDTTDFQAVMVIP